jgi:hypothetical protein
LRRTRRHAEKKSPAPRCRVSYPSGARRHQNGAAMSSRAPGPYLSADNCNSTSSLPGARISPPVAREAATMALISGAPHPQSPVWSRWRARAATRPLEQRRRRELALNQGINGLRGARLRGASGRHRSQSIHPGDIHRLIRAGRANLTGSSFCQVTLGTWPDLR